MASAQYLGEPSLVVVESDLEPREKWKELGRGAFSVVYKAFCQLHNVNVAVKEIRRGNELHEIQKLVKLSSHDHVVKIKAVLEMPNGKSGIVMEFCEYGLQTLRDTLGSNFIPWPRCLLFMQHITNGLQFLHHNNITHRDLKPENVMVTNSFQCKIADVGLAKAYHSRSNTSSDAQIICPSGTPFYISPERWRNPLAVATQTDDIYSCGILFYKMITNADLFYMERMPQDHGFFSQLKMYVADSNYRPETSELDKGPTRAPAIVKDVITTCWDAESVKRKSFHHLTSLLREEITKMYTEEMIQESDNELRQLLQKNGTNISKKRSVLRDSKPKESIEKSSPSTDKMKLVEPNLPTSTPSLQPLKSVEEGMGNLSTQDDFQVLVLDGKIVASHYGLELLASYTLTTDTDSRKLHFNHVNGHRISIPTKNIHSHQADVISSIVYVNVWAGAEHGKKQLSLSASSVWEVYHMLDDILTGNTVVEGKPLRTDGHFPAQNFSRTPPHSSYPPSSGHLNPGPYHWPPPPVPGPTSGGASISIGYVHNFYNTGHGDGVPSVVHPPPYLMDQLTTSEEMVSTDDMTVIAPHVASKYDAVSRLMGLESQSKIIRTNYRDDIEEASYKLIQAWVQTYASDATKKELAQILYRAKLYDAAKQLR